MRNTKSRTQILKLLTENEQAFSAKMVHERLPQFDLATIYRTLNLFVEKGLVRELRINKEESLYEINEDGHEHAICNNCGEVRHIEIDKEKLKELIRVQGFKIDDIELNIKGRCAES